MPLVFGALAPHPPLLIPAIGQENLKKLAKTKLAFQFLEEQIYSQKIDTLIVISPHGTILKEAFNLNHSPILAADFEAFGDFETKTEYSNDMALAYQIKESMETDFSVILSTDEKLDHGAGVPLFYLTAHLKNFKIIPIGYSLLEPAKHFEFGKRIRKQLDKTPKRVAIIASGDMSHRLTKKSPAGFAKEGKVFDETITRLVREKNIAEILNFDSALIEAAGECGYRSLLILLGALSNLNFESEVLSYEAPFGVGYLTAAFKL